MIQLFAIDFESISPSCWTIVASMFNIDSASILASLIGVEPQNGSQTSAPSTLYRAKKVPKAESNFGLISNGYWMDVGSMLGQLCVLFDVVCIIWASCFRASILSCCKGLIFNDFKNRAENFLRNPILQRTHHKILQGLVG